MNLQPAFAFALVITVVGGLALYQPGQYRALGDQTGYSPAQPIEFSHKEHAKEYSIPCEYCHSSARKGPVAGIPAATTCMNCHSQIDKNEPEIRKIAAAVQTGEPIRWVRVHQMADFVRFNHSAHVTKGIACQTCHGPVETMSRIEVSRNMTMGWCVNCHRRYNVHPPRGMTNVQASVECSTCHY